MAVLLKVSDVALSANKITIFIFSKICFCTAEYIINLESSPLEKQRGFQDGRQRGFNFV